MQSAPITLSSLGLHMVLHREEQCMSGVNRGIEVIVSAHFWLVTSPHVVGVQAYSGSTLL